MKQRHEFKIALEAGIALPPFMRIHSLRLRKFPLLGANSIIPLTSTTILKGDNGVGKTAIIEQILGAVKGTLFSRWNEDEISIDFILDNLSTSVINYNCNAGDRRFTMLRGYNWVMNRLIWKCSCCLIIILRLTVIMM